jgi:anti-sigma factor RsiW
MVDGQLAAGRHREVMAYLAVHPDAAGRATALLEQRVELAALREALIDGEAELQLTDSEAALCRVVRKQGRVRRALQASGVLVLTVAAVSGWWFSSHETVATQTRASNGERQISPVQATLADMKADGADAGDPAILWLQAHLIGRSLKQPNLKPFGLHFAGSSILRSEGGPAIQLVYTDNRGSKYNLTVGVRQSGVELESSIVPEHYISLTWQHELLIFSLAAPQGSTQLDEIMHSASDLLIPLPIAANARLEAGDKAGEPGSTAKDLDVSTGSMLESVAPQAGQARSL